MPSRAPTPRPDRHPQRDPGPGHGRKNAHRADSGLRTRGAYTVQHLLESGVPSRTAERYENVYPECQARSLRISIERNSDSEKCGRDSPVGRNPLRRYRFLACSLFSRTHNVTAEQSCCRAHVKVVAIN